MCLEYENQVEEYYYLILCKIYSNVICTSTYMLYAKTNK